MAVEHFVAFKFKPDVSEARREEHMENLRSLESQIGVIRSLRCGRNFTDRAKGFDYGLIVTVADRHSLQVYADHPSHIAVAGPLKADCDDVFALDFEC